MLNIVLFGPPGAGKGTQADKLKERYRLNHLSTGEVIRQEIKAGTALGLEAQEQMKDGSLASDDIVIGIIGNYIESHRDGNGTIFDGFPRTTPQAEAFDMMLSQHGQSVTVPCHHQYRWGGSGGRPRLGPFRRYSISISSEKITFR